MARAQKFILLIWRAKWPLNGKVHFKPTHDAKYLIVNYLILLKTNIKKNHRHPCQFCCQRHKQLLLIATIQLTNLSTHPNVIWLHLIFHNFGGYNLDLVPPTTSQSNPKCQINTCTQLECCHIKTLEVSPLSACPACGAAFWSSTKLALAACVLCILFFLWNEIIPREILMAKKKGNRILHL